MLFNAYFPVVSEWSPYLWKPYCGGRRGVWRGPQWWRPLLLQCKAPCWSSVSPQTWESVQVPHLPPTFTNLTHLALLFRVLVMLIWFYASVQVRACAADETVDLSQQVRAVMRRQTVREPACVQVCPPTVLSREPRRTSRCAVWGRGSAWTG